MAAGFFCRAITSAGHDVENLITALGERGLGEPCLQGTQVVPCFSNLKYLVNLRIWYNYCLNYWTSCAGARFRTCTLSGSRFTVRQRSLGPPQWQHALLLTISCLLAPMRC